MNINFELLDLRVFLAILDLHSFHKAAKQLNLSQPALSRRIQSLEERLGVPLLERSTRHVAPTAAGRTLEPMARRLLDELDSTLMSITGIGEHQSGYITIALIPTAALYFMPRVIQEFNSKYPRIGIRMLDRAPQECLDCVVHGEVEFGINMIGATEKDIIFTHLVDDPYVFVCRHDHPLAKRKDLAWADLSGHALIRIGRPNSGNRAVLDTALAKVNLQLEWFYEVNNLTTAVGLVEAGFAASILPYLAAPVTPHPVVAVVPIRRPVEVTRTIGIIERRNGRLSPAAKFFRDMILKTWRDRKVVSVRRDGTARARKVAG